MASYEVDHRNVFKDVPLESILELLGPLGWVGATGGLTSKLEDKFGVLLESLECAGDSTVVINDGCQYLTISRVDGTVTVSEGIAQVSKYDRVITMNPLERGYSPGISNSPEARRLRRVLMAQERIIDDIISHFSTGGNIYHTGHYPDRSGWPDGQPPQQEQIHPTRRILKQYALREIEAAYKCEESHRQNVPPATDQEHSYQQPPWATPPNKNQHW